MDFVTVLVLPLRRSFVRLGEWNTGSTNDCNGTLCADPVIDVPIETTFVRSYDTTYIWHNNIGLVRLSDRVTYTKWISPICLPIANYFYESQNLYSNQSFVITGFNENTCM